MSGIVSFGIYISFFGISTACLCYRSREKKFNAINIIGIVIVVLFAAMRYNVGTDFMQYSKNFLRYYNMPWSRIIFELNDGWGLAASIKVLYGIGGRTLSFGYCAFLTFFPVYFYLRNEWDNTKLAIPILWFLSTAFIQSFNLTSQYIAIGITFYGLKYVYENKFLRYVLIVFIAFLFHKSALLATAIYFMWDHKKNTAVSGSKSFLIVTITLVLVLFYHELMLYLSQNYSIFGDYSYFVNVEEMRNRDFYLNAFQLVFILSFYRKLVELDEKNRLLVLSLIVAVIIGLTGFTHPQFKRSAFYFSVPATTILIGQVSNFSIQTGRKRISNTVLSIGYTLFRFILVYYIIDSLHYAIEL